MWNALGEDLLGHPRAVRLALGKVDHCFFRPAKVEGSPAAIHRFSDRPHVRVGIFVEQLEEQTEVGHITFMRGCGHQQQVVGGPPEELSERVSRGLAGRWSPRHSVRLIYDGKVPMDLSKARKDVLALCQVQRGKYVLVLQPLIDAKLVPDSVPLQNDELFIKFLFQFALPLEGQVCWADDQDALGETAELEFADK